MLAEVLQQPTLHAVQSCRLPIGLAAQCLDDLRHSFFLGLKLSPWPG